MRIRWTPNAATDLQRIYDYLSEHEPHLARPTVIEIRKSARSLKKFPMRGRKGREEGTRELFPTPLRYRLKNRAGTLQLRSGQALGHWAVESKDSPPTLTGMGVHFTPEQEAQLSQIAGHAGTDTERLVDCRREFVSASMGEFPDGRRRI